MLGRGEKKLERHVTCLCRWIFHEKDFVFDCLQLSMTRVSILRTVKMIIPESAVSDLFYDFITTMLLVHVTRNISDFL